MNQAVTESSKSQGVQGLPTSPEKLMADLNALSIEYTLYHHEAVFTVEESNKVDGNIEGTHCRNLFLRDKKKKNYR